MGKFTKQNSTISLEDFLSTAARVKSFHSSRGNRYEVIKIQGSIMHFTRLDAKSNEPWNFDLKDVYNAYSNLDDFRTESFRQYVPIRHSPARGLLIHLGLLN